VAAPPLARSGLPVHRILTRGPTTDIGRVRAASERGRRGVGAGLVGRRFGQRRRAFGAPTRGHPGRSAEGHAFPIDFVGARSASEPSIAAGVRHGLERMREMRSGYRRCFVDSNPVNGTIRFLWWPLTRGGPQRFVADCFGEPGVMATVG